VVAYLLCFASFEKDYFTTYKEQISDVFCEGIGDAFEFANSQLPLNSKMYVDPDVSYPRILFYGKVDLNSYLSTVRYTNFPSAFLYVHEFDKYVFTSNLRQNGPRSVFILENKGSRFQTLQDSGYSIRNFGKYIVAY
jgi:hypothetical protein